MKPMALLVIDVQTALIEKQPFHALQVLDNLLQLLTVARKQGHEVIYVRHDDGVGTELEQGTAGWEIDSRIAPVTGEVIFEKTFNSAFHKTDLNPYLKSRGIDTLILTGLQTEYCVDATLKSAFDLGYHLIVPRDTNTTFDNEYLSGEQLYQFYNEKIWAGRFARVLDLENVVALMKEPRLLEHA